MNPAIIRFGLFFASLLFPFVHSQTCDSALWSNTRVEMNAIKKSIEVSADNEVVCAAMAMQSDHSVYCYDGRQCVHGLFGPSAPPNEDPPSPWKCKTNTGNCMLQIMKY